MTILLFIVLLPIWLPIFLISELFKTPAQREKEKKEVQIRIEQRKFEEAVEKEMEKLRVQEEAKQRRNKEQEYQKRVEEEALKRFYKTLDNSKNL